VEAQKVRRGYEKTAEEKYPYPPEPRLDADLETGQKDIWQVKEAREDWRRKKAETDKMRAKYVEAAVAAKKEPHPPEPDTVKESKWPPPVGTMPLVFWFAGGTLIGISATFGIQAKDLEDNAKDPNFVGAQLKAERCERFAMIANMGIALGTAAIITGLVAWLTSGEKGERRTSFLPVLTTESAGAAMAIEF
jgi:hypothetical protein